MGKQEERNRQQWSAMLGRGEVGCLLGVVGSVLTLVFGGWGKEFFRQMRKIGRRKKSCVLLYYSIDL